MRLNRKAFSCLLLFYLGLGFPPKVCATTVLEQTFPELVQQAEVIVVGTVTGIQEQWDATRQAPLTNVTFSQLTVLKGTLGEDSMVLEFFGGHTPDGRVLAISGVPQFTIGEKTVVFCTGNHRDFCPLVGIWQGLLRVTFDQQRGEEIVSDNFRVPVIGVQDGKMLKLTPEVAVSTPLSLSAFMDLIKQEVGTANGQP